MGKIDNKYKKIILIMTKVPKIIFYKLKIEKVQLFTKSIN